MENITDPKENVKSEEGVSLIKREFTELSRVKTQFDQTQIKFITETLAPTLTPNEIMLFIYRAQKLGLNPLNGEIFAYASFETVGDQKVRKMVIIVARDGKRRKAFETNHLKTISTEAIYVKKDEKGNNLRVTPWEGGTLWGAKCVITRDDFADPFITIVPLSEYNTGYKAWRGKPETMIKKVAQSQCLSEAFPELAGVYDES